MLLACPCRGPFWWLLLLLLLLLPMLLLLLLRRRRRLVGVLMWRLGRLTQRLLPVLRRRRLVRGGRREVLARLPHAIHGRKRRS